MRPATAKSDLGTRDGAWQVVSSSGRRYRDAHALRDG